MTAAVLIENNSFAQARMSLERGLAKPRRRIGWSTLPMTVEPNPAPAEDIPVYSVTLEPPAPRRGELRWLGRLICFATALGSAGGVIALCV